MQILFDNPSRATWRLVRVTKPGQAPFFLTDWYSDGRIETIRRARHYECGKGTLDYVDNVVIQADLKAASFARGRSSVSYCFEDRDAPGHLYHLGGKAVLNFLKAIQDGRIELIDGHFRGRYTFAKEGQNVSLHVYDKPIEDDGSDPDVEGAIDVSEYLLAQAKK